MVGTDAHESLDRVLELCAEREVTADHDRAITRWIEQGVVPDVAVIDAIREARPMKTEDGQKFPAEAYAYVPDPDKPSTWKLRLWESPSLKVTRKQLGAAAAAFSPGGFRGQKVQIPAEDVAKVKGRIRAAYRALKVEPKNIPKAVKENEPMKRVIAREASTLLESDYDEALGEATITIIKPGFNESKQRFYPKETLARDYKVFEGLKMFADHQTSAEERAKPERSIREWVAQIKPKSVFVAEDGSIKARVAIIEDWLKGKMSNLKKAGLLSEMGTSIVAAGEAYKTEIEGHKTDFIERIVRGRSVDFVTYPGAGGMVECYESARPEDEFDVDVITLEGLKERRPDIIEQVAAEVKGTLDGEIRSMSESERELKELKESVDTLTAERDELKTKIAANEAEKAKLEAQESIKSLIAEAELPDATKARLTDQFVEAETVDGVAEAIEAAKKELAELTEAGIVKQLGNTRPADDNDAGKVAERLHEAMKQHYQEQGYDNDTAEQMATTYVKGH
ncbi:MAG: hypothetical protein JRG73_16420 [Deltaproteobacteria bacterium]|nr:hypothetical protein [Deltaproteobacteria bacterium]